MLCDHINTWENKNKSRTLPFYLLQSQNCAKHPNKINPKTVTSQFCITVLYVSENLCNIFWAHVKPFLVGRLHGLQVLPFKEKTFLVKQIKIA